MSIQEFRALTDEELTNKLHDLRQRKFELTRAKAVGNLEHPEEIRQIRKDIAKGETVRRERQLGIHAKEDK